MYKIHLILKYLLKRRIAWVSLGAVALCTMMVLVVISVMGGWLNMFKTSFRGLSGDLVIETDSLSGFRYYDEIIAELKQDPECQVKTATTAIKTYGLLDYGKGPIPVQVMGMKIEEMGTVNAFPQSLNLQYKQIQADLKNPKLTAVQRAAMEKELQTSPSFDLMDEVSVPMDALPTGLKYAESEPGKDVRAGTIELPKEFTILNGWLRYDALRHRLLLRGFMPAARTDGFPAVLPEEWKDKFITLSPDPAYKAAITELFAKLKTSYLIPYSQFVHGKAHGLITGTGVIGLRRDETGVMRRGPEEYTTPMHLTVLNMSNGELDAGSKITRNYFIVDDSHLGVWQYDSMYVYVPFDLLQKDLGLDAQAATRDDRPIVLPARATDIYLKVNDGIDTNNEVVLHAIGKKVEAAVRRVTERENLARGELDGISATPKVETWQDTQRIWISAVENEKLLTVMLFGIMCIVAIFLIFCIFYMIVVEKTKDIGIIKSVGATSGGVAGIFLGYGLVIGIVGSLFGLLLSFGIIHWINPMHALLGKWFGLKIWDPQVYMFDNIPNTMSMKDIAWILPTAIVASVLGALIPAIRAARMNPVDALRWE